jgi:hypothetical protein
MDAKLNGVYNWFGGFVTGIIGFAVYKFLTL